MVSIIENKIQDLKQDHDNVAEQINSLMSQKQEIEVTLATLTQKLNYIRGGIDELEKIVEKIPNETE